MIAHVNYATVSVEIMNLKTSEIKIIYETIMYIYNNIRDLVKYQLSNQINGNIFFNFRDSSESNILFHYNVYMEEFLGKYQMGSKFTAFDINLNVLATCQNNSIQVYNLC